MTASCELLHWDTAFFGRTIGRVTESRLDEAQMSAVLTWCRGEGVDCLYMLVAGVDVRTAAIVARNGFVLVDVRVELAARLDEVEIVASDALVRSYRPGDLPALKALARTSHRDSRFYSDSRFARDRCDALYEMWIERSCNGGADAVLVPDVAQRAVGYVTCHLEMDGVGRVGLFAISQAARGRGIGRHLIGAALAWFREHERRRVTVVTQGRNVAAQRLYQGCGFRTSAMGLWYHRWSSR